MSICACLQDGATALFKASHKGHSSVIEELLKYKPSLGLLPVSSKLITLKSLDTALGTIKTCLKTTKVTCT